MLVLMRRPGESIHIGSNIVITLISLDRNRARIGIEAPRDITIDREEIAEKKKQEAAGLAPAQSDGKSQDSAPAEAAAPLGRERAEHVEIRRPSNAEAATHVPVRWHTPATETARPAPGIIVKRKRRRWASR